MRMTRLRLIVLLVLTFGLGTAVWLGVRQGQGVRLQGPLTAAIYRGDATTVRSLLAQGADPNSREDDGPPPTPWQTLRELLTPRRRPVHTTANPVLMLAVLRRNKDIVQALLNNGARVDTRDASGVSTPLMIACANGGTEIAPLLLGKGADPNGRNGFGLSVLIIAVVEGDPRVVQMLITHGADVNANTGNGLTPLRWAMENKKTADVRLLKQAGAHL